MSKYESEVTMYSDKITGDEGNYNWAVTFDNTGPERYKAEPGHIGITQYDEHGELKERVLLSPGQVQEFIKFAHRIRKIE